MTDKEERERAKLAQQIAEVAELMPMRIDLERQLAKITRIKFLALVAEGFTQEQALELCKGKP
jgi:hypothetical protein